MVYIRHDGKVLKRAPTSGGWKKGEGWAGRNSGKCANEKTTDYQVAMADENLKRLQQEAQEAGLDPQEVIRDMVDKRLANIISYLYSILANDEEKGAARVAASKVLLERAYGAVPQTITMNKREESVYTLEMTNPHTGESVKTITAPSSAVSRVEEDGE